MPSTFGIRMSMTTTSGVDCSARATASAPALASATTVIPASARASRRTPRSRALSSAMRIRIDSATMGGKPTLSPGGSATGAGRSRLVQALDAILCRGRGGRWVEPAGAAQAVERRERVARAGGVREPPAVARDDVLLALHDEDAPLIGSRDQELGHLRPAGRLRLLLVQLQRRHAVQQPWVDRAQPDRAGLRAAREALAIEADCEPALR